MPVFVSVFISDLVKTALAEILIKHVFRFNSRIWGYFFFIGNEEAILAVVDTLFLDELEWAVLAVEGLDPWFEPSEVLQCVLVLVDVQD